MYQPFDEELCWFWTDTKSGTVGSKSPKFAWIIAAPRCRSGIADFGNEMSRTELPGHRLRRQIFDEVAVERGFPLAM